MCSSLGASANMCEGLLVAQVDEGEPKKPFTWPRLSESTKAFSLSSQKTYWPPRLAGQAYCRSGRNRARISRGRTASTSRTATTAGSFRGANSRSVTVNAGWT